jgi:hypothetical protein
MNMAMLIVLSVLAITALADASTASADTLCKVNEKTCSFANEYPENEPFSFTSANVMLRGSNGAVTTCTGTFSGTLLGRDPGVGVGRAASITAATYVNCTGACMGASPINLPWSGTYTALGGGAGRLSIVNEQVLLSGCRFAEKEVEKCAYLAKEVVLDFKGGKGVKAKEPALITAEKETLLRTKESSALCPESMAMSGVFEVTKPEEGFFLVG